jgi:uncharacterized protein
MEKFFYILTNIRFTFPIPVRFLFLFLSIISLSSCSTASDKSAISAEPIVAEKHLWQENSETTWNKLQHYSTAHLLSLQKNADNDIQKGWIQLALINKQNSLDNSELVRALLVWRQDHPNHPGNQLLPADESLQQLLSHSSPQHIAVLLPQTGPFAAPGQMVRDGFLSAYYENSSNQSVTVKFYDTHGNNVVKLYRKAIADGANMIVGPITKTEVQQLSSAESFPVPTLALNYTNGRLPANFYEFGLLSKDEVEQMAQKAYAGGHSRALIIAPQNPWGNKIASSFRAQWTQLGGTIQDSLHFSSAAKLNQEIALLLKVDPPKRDSEKRDRDDDNTPKPVRSDVDVIFLFAPPPMAHLIVPILKYYGANHLAIYASSSVYSGTSRSDRDRDLNGVIICDIPWKNTSEQTDRLYAVGKDAYLLNQTLHRLLLMPNFAIYGKTGALTINAQQQIHRRLPCRIFHNGQLR